MSGGGEIRYYPDEEQDYKSCSSLEEGNFDLFGNYAVGRFVISLFDRMIQWLIENGREGLEQDCKSCLSIGKNLSITIQS